MILTAPRSPGHEDDRHFAGLQEYFGDNSMAWTNDLTGDTVGVTIVCYDTLFPTRMYSDSIRTF